MAASKLHKHRGQVALLSGRYTIELYIKSDYHIKNLWQVLKHIESILSNEKYYFLMVSDSLLELRGGVRINSLNFQIFRATKQKASQIDLSHNDVKCGFDMNFSAFDVIRRKVYCLFVNLGGGGIILIAKPRITN